MSDTDSQLPPVGEEIHLPGPTILPLLTAVGITATIIGTTLNWDVSIAGLVLFLVAVGLWIRDTRHDIAELPEDHGSH